MSAKNHPIGTDIQIPFNSFFFLCPVVLCHVGENAFPKSCTGMYAKESIFTAAANALAPRYLPTTQVSATLYSCCNRFPNINGRAKSNKLTVIGPFVKFRCIFISYPNFNLEIYQLFFWWF